MISVIYVIFSTILIIYLSFQVIKTRRKLRISVGDGNNEELQTAQGAQSNAIEYIPISLLLLFYLEYNGASNWIIHLTGIALIAGRIVHAHGLLNSNLQRRVMGMQITITVLIGLCILNLGFLPLEKLMQF
jgi:hypothetical protein